MRKILFALVICALVISAYAYAYQITIGQTGETGAEETEVNPEDI